MKKNDFQIKSWIKKAKDDFNFAQDTFLEDKHWDYVCWLAQQSVEKNLKAYIIEFRGKLDKKDQTHNLIYLSKIAKKFGLDLSPFEKELRWLSDVYISSRYPVYPIVRFLKKDAKKSIEIAEKINEVILEKLL